MDYQDVFCKFLNADALDGPSGWIQWKGTEVCIDLLCKCGKREHYDGDFLYFFQCPHCQRVYSVGASVRLFELTAEEADVVEESIKTVQIEDDSLCPPPI